MSNDYINTVAEFLPFLHKDKILQLANDEKVKPEAAALIDPTVLAILESSWDTGARWVEDRLRAFYVLPFTEKKEEVTMLVAWKATEILYKRHNPLSPEALQLQKDLKEKIDELTDPSGSAQVGSGMNNQAGPVATIFDEKTQTTITATGVKNSYSNVNIFRNH